MRPSVFPSNRTGSKPGPSQYANVQMAVAPLSSKPVNRRLSPVLSILLRTIQTQFVQKVFNIGSRKAIECVER